MNLKRGLSNMIKAIKANTDIINLFNQDDSFINALRYYSRKGTKEYYSKLFEATQQAFKLAPAFIGYIALKELELGKQAKDFNELERYSTIEEFKKINYTANKLLDNKL